MSDYSHTTDVDEDDDLEDWPQSTPATSSRASSVSSSAFTPYGTPSHGLPDDNNDDNERALPGLNFGFNSAPGSNSAFASTAFDIYFLHASKPSRTSAHVFSHLVSPLSPEEYTAALARLPPPRTLWEDDTPARRALFARCAGELREGFNVLFYGYGSKRRVLNAFARVLARGCGSGGGGGRGTGGAAHVVVVNGFQPGFALRDLLDAIDAIPVVQAAGGAAASGAAGVEAQTQRIYDMFANAMSDDGDDEDVNMDTDADTDSPRADAPHLYLVIHNIDGPGLRTAKAKACLARLALAPRIHLVASIDHIAAPSRWTLAELFARKPESMSRAPRDVKGKGKAGDKSKGKGKARATDAETPHAGADLAVPALPHRGFAWLWHDLTTLAPYDFELAGADPASLSSASAGSRRALASTAAPGAPGAGTQIVAESAARHVLASVTQKARKLFVLLGDKQLELMADPASGAGGSGGAGADAAYDYARLFSAARDEFVATSDGALRALLAEFRDHGLVVSVTVGGVGGAGGGQGGGETLWIPMRREALARVVAEVRAEGE